MDQNPVLGVISAVIAIVTYGSTYVPVRWFEAGDGLYFQWLMCMGQFLVGCVVYLIDGCPPFAPLAMLGGVFFALGNALTVFIMDGVGMAVGSLLWNTGTCVVGWAVSRFGLFGTPATQPYHDVLNIVGVMAVCIGGCFFAPIKHHPMKVRPAPAQFVKFDLEDEKRDEAEVEDALPRVASTSKRVIALLMTVFVGFLYGNMLTPINYVIAKGGAPHTHSHFFAHCIGTMLTATIIFTIYAGIKKNRPFVNPELTLPSIGAGVVYGIATCTMFMANQHLGQVIAYPIISKSPGIITTLWAVLLFKEIRGRWNIAALVAGIFTTLAGVTMISISKIPF